MQPAVQLGHNIREARIAAGLTQADLGDFAGGIDRHTIAAIENGQATKQLERVLTLLDALGLEVELVPRAVRRARTP